MHSENSKVGQVAALPLQPPHFVMVLENAMCRQG